MKKIYIAILLISLAVVFSYAQQPLIPVKGHVTNKQTGAPVVGQTMYVILDELNSTYYNKTETDNDGYYSFILPFNSFAMQGTFTVYTNDCNGSVISGTGTYIPGNEAIIIDFSICGNSQSICQASFKYVPAADNTLTYAFYNGSQIMPGTAIPGYFWDFNDGTTSIEQDPVHTFTKTGFYNVCLSILSSDSLCSSNYCLPVQVGSPIPDPCENSFWYYNDSTGKEYIFNGWTSNEQADSWIWDFGDGTSATGQTVSHSYASTNNYYKVCLTTTVIGPEGTACTSQSCQEVYIYFPDPCGNSFSYFPDSSGSGYTFQSFTNNTNVNSWIWDFGDGTTGKGEFVTHSFKGQNEIYKVCLTTVGVGAEGAACRYTSCQEVYYSFPSPCENSFWYQSDSSESQFTFQGWTKNNQASSWNWDFGDGTTATGQTVSHSFPETNVNYTVCLTTTGINYDGTACTYSTCHDVYIYKPSPCESSFWYYIEPTGSGYTFEGYTNSNAISSWAWDFGDGTTASGQKVFHSFKDFNTTYYVCLTTTGTGPDGETCTYNSCNEVYMDIPSPCENYFKANTNDGLTYSFSGNLNSGNPAAYYWDFGDGYTGTGQQVEHTFKGANAGFFYNVCLTTLTGDPAFNDTCSSTSCQVISPGAIDSTCQASIYAVPDASGYTFQFENISQNYNSLFSWDFGDGNQSAEAKPVHSYSSPGIYMVCLTLLDSLKNCNTHSCMEIWVNMIEPNECQASFSTWANDSVSDNLSFTFINTSWPGYTNQKWSFGDGTGSSDINPTHTYAASGIYTACLTIWDSLSVCQSAYCMDIYAGKIVGNNTVTGIVMAGNTLADKGIVWLISPDNNYNAETQIAADGTYTFKGIPYGKYYIYAMLTPGSAEFFAYLPTYYKNSMNWQEATLITTGEPNAWYPVMLIPSTSNNQGNAGINGNVNWTDASGTPMSPASNVEIVLYNSAGEPVAYTFTGNDGTYQFANLPYGEYTLHAEMAGKNNQTVTVSLSSDSAFTNINFLVDQEAINAVGIVDKKNPKLQAGNPYPNPVVETLKLDLNASASGIAMVDIVTVQGLTLHSESVALSGGNNRISINTGKLTKGIYILRITSDGNNAVLRKFIK